MKLFALLFLLPSPAGAGLLTGQGAAVLDSNSLARPTFTNSERVTFQQKVHNGAASAGRIAFSFDVTGPGGATVFSHAGNAVPGAVGFSASSVSGVPIAQFYAGPGVYQLRAQAVLDGQTVAQSASFTVSSPNILLIYPPNGASGLADSPLTFRWSSSGASTYRLTVGDNPSLYNSVFTAQTAGSEGFLSYPVNPPDPRQRLAAGQIYYWKVEALDAAGQRIAASQTPFAFSVAAAALSKDMAVTGITVRPGSDRALTFEITVRNQGGTTEANVPLKFSVGGLAAPGTPIVMAALAPGESRAYVVVEALPSDQSQSLAVACLEFSDDSIANNCKTLLVTPPAASGSGADTGRALSFGYTREQLWQQVQELLRGKGYDLSDYSLTADAGYDDLKALLDALKSGEGSVNVTGSTEGLAPPPAPAPAPSLAGAPAPPKFPAAPPLPDAAPPPAKEAEDPSVAGQEWTGLASPVTRHRERFTVKNAEHWRELWNRLREGRPPAVAFPKHMIVGIMAAAQDRAEGIQLVEWREGETESVARYRLVGRRKDDGAAAPAKAPYLLKEVVAADKPIRFEDVEESKR